MGVWFNEHHWLNIVLLQIICHISLCNESCESFNRNSQNMLILYRNCQLPFTFIIQAKWKIIKMMPVVQQKVTAVCAINACALPPWKQQCRSAPATQSMLVQQLQQRCICQISAETENRVLRADELENKQKKMSKLEWMQSM